MTLVGFEAIIKLHVMIKPSVDLQDTIEFQCRHHEDMYSGAL